MIITLVKANFGSSNIGTSTTWVITPNMGSGASYSGVTSVTKGAALNATVTIAEGYEIGSAGVSVTMGGVTQSGAYSTSSDGKTITITIGTVTGNVVIKVSTVNTTTGEEDGGSTGTGLDAIAYGGKTYRDIFINANIMPNINNNVLLNNASNSITYKQYNEEYPVTIKQSSTAETNYVPSYYMDVSGTQSRYLQKASGEANTTEGEVFFGGVNVKVTDWSAGRVGINVGTNYSLDVVDRVTNGYERLTSKIVAGNNEGYFIGSTGKASLTGYINNPVLVRGSIFGANMPSESEWTTLYNNYCDILCNNA